MNDPHLAGGCGFNSPPLQSDQDIPHQTRTLPSAGDMSVPCNASDGRLYLSLLVTSWSGSGLDVSWCVFACWLALLLLLRVRSLWLWVRLLEVQLRLAHFVFCYGYKSMNCQSGTFIQLLISRCSIKSNFQ